MARETIARTPIPVTGLDLTDVAFETLATGAGNGVEFPFRGGDILVLTHSSAAVFTIVTPQPAKYDDRGIEVDDMTVNVGQDEMHLIPLDIFMRQADGNVYVDCDVAADVLVLGLS